MYHYDEHRLTIGCFYREPHSSPSRYTLWRKCMACSIFVFCNDEIQLRLYHGITQFLSFILLIIGHLFNSEWHGWKMKQMKTKVCVYECMYMCMWRYMEGGKLIYAKWIPIMICDARDSIKRNYAEKYTINK